MNRCCWRSSNERNRADVVSDHRASAACIRNGLRGHPTDAWSARAGSRAGTRYAVRQRHVAARHVRHSQRQHDLLRSLAGHRAARLRRHRGVDEVPYARGGDRMSLANLPDWTAWLASASLLLGAGLCFIGSVGLLRLRKFYDRVHAPTLGTTLGTTFILLASVLCFSVLESRLVIHEILIAIFVTVT